MKVERKAAVAAGMCILLLGCLAVAFCLNTGNRPRPTQEDGAWGMLLIDIADQASADQYHVNQTGVYVLAVEEQSRAYQEGVRPGDRVISVNGRIIQSAAELSELPAGLVALELERAAGERFSLSLQMDEVQ